MRRSYVGFLLTIPVAVIVAFAAAASVDRDGEPSGIVASMGCADGAEVTLLEYGPGPGWDDPIDALASLGSREEGLLRGGPEEESERGLPGTEADEFTPEEVAEKFRMLSEGDDGFEYEYVGRSSSNITTTLLVSWIPEGGYRVTRVASCVAVET
jgi:hypothetical protein